MNYGKVQSEIISEIYKREAKKLRLPLFDKMPGTGYVGVITDGAFAYIFPKSCFLLDESRMPDTKMLSNIYDREAYTTDLTWNGITRKEKARTVIELLTAKGGIVLLNEKIVKKFGNPSDLRFMSEGVGKVVFVYDIESSFLAGVIAPIKE